MNICIPMWKYSQFVKNWYFQLKFSKRLRTHSFVDRRIFEQEVVRDIVRDVLMRWTREDLVHGHLEVLLQWIRICLVFPTFSELERLRFISEMFEWGFRAYTTLFTVAYLLRMMLNHMMVVMVIVREVDCRQRRMRLRNHSMPSVHHPVCRTAAKCFKQLNCTNRCQKTKF